ncbi:LuxR family transcriptional regulator [Cellulosimicrobium sp. CUA-896]|uniref:helix-turn-helix transcriptional regulator n=1 Tax=Cellulosimicrobium sp. CUA-896 TaxID=1517881 RepID=UPI0009602CCD|nr:LuxR family transcriptional regulator [Cellulosimicrobium sp. CUA-896]OLT46132.1 hypothetical protein BJF88_04750 [Cellulosimicrobium sp. CUA-896]
MGQLDPPRTLVGRRRETDRLDRLVASLRGGQSRALVVRADAGMGKTALLERTAVAASGGCRVLRAAGVESERELPYAGVHRLCAPLLDGLDALPEPQATALGVALGLRAGPAPDRFLVGLAVLSLLSGAAERQPLLCLVDDAQWLDQASTQALTFAARRLAVESVGMVFAVREPVTEGFTGIEELVVTGLEDVDARRLLDRGLTGPVDEGVRARLVAEAHGNPLALIELSDGTTVLELAGGYRSSGPAGVIGRIEGSFARRIGELGPRTRTALLIAALEPVGDPTLVLAAAGTLGMDADAFAPAIEDGLVELGARLRFRHPLVRSAAVRCASGDERREAHRALAAVTDEQTEPDRRAWHRSEAVVGLDEEVAAELVASARRARARGGAAAAAAFHARAAELTPDRTTRSLRALTAAEDTFRAGSMHEASRLLELCEPDLLDAAAGARADLVRARIVFSTTRGREAPPLLLAAARALEVHDGAAAVTTYAEALLAGLSAGSSAREGGGVGDVAAGILGARLAEPLDDESRLMADALRGLAVLVRDGYAAAAPGLKKSLAAFLDRAGRGEPGSDAPLRWLPLGCLVARVLLDDVASDRLSRAFVETSLRGGAFSTLPLAAAERIVFLLMAGRIVDAEDLFTQARAVIAATSAPESMYRRGWIASFRGDVAAKAEFTERWRDRVVERGEAQWLLTVAWLDGFLFDSLGRYEEALDSVGRADGHPFDIGMSAWALSEHVEAAVRAGAPGRAAAPLARLREQAEAMGTDWAVGLARRATALASADDDAEAAYAEAVDRHGRTRAATAHARSQLVYGEWLRRQGRRVDARGQLHAAYEAFAAMGAHALAERARRELSATGEVVHRTGAGPGSELTAQERQIARLASTGSTNPEIGALLYLSPRTVEWHLRKVYTKLGVSSRRQLAPALTER